MSFRFVTSIADVLVLFTADCGAVSLFSDVFVLCIDVFYPTRNVGKALLPKLFDYKALVCCYNAKIFFKFSQL